MLSFHSLGSDTVVALIIACIAAIGPTLVGWASWRSSKRTEKNTDTANGKRLGELAEMNHASLEALRADLELHKVLPPLLAHRPLEKVV